MKTIVNSLIALMVAVAASEARIWTDLQGRTVEAKVIKVNPNRTVALKTDRGKTKIVPFDTFSDEDVDYLDDLLARTRRESLHSVTWEQMNEAFGLEIWQDERLWDDLTMKTAERLAMDQESQTDFMENFRTYPLGEDVALGEPVYTTVLYGGPEFVDSYSMVFLNKGDPVEVNGRYRSPSSKQIEECGERIEETLLSLLGESTRTSLGRDTLREKVWRWDWNEHAILLSLQEEKYVAMRIMPMARADNGGRNEKLSDDVLKKRVADCVIHRNNGDVVISNIPMIDQGPKGYCSPATWERYLRYLDISADMYLLALAAGTTGSQGTYSPLMITATRNIVSSNGRKLVEINESPTMELVSKYIDLGLPIMWRMESTPVFRKAIHENTARRKGEEPEEEDFGKGRGGHICLIIGYNKNTNELATTDSWGVGYAERWVQLNSALSVSRRPMSVIKW
jgi:hypothetical protein